MIYRLSWLFFAFMVVFIDQLSKWVVVHSLLPLQSLPLFPGLNLTLTYNMGAAFSFLSTEGGWQRWMLSIIAIVVCAIILIWFFRLPRKQLLLSFALMSILGGAIGNLIDRIYYGYVIDFIDVYLYQWHWYTFNLADAAITIGAGLMLLDAILEGKKG